MKTRNIVVLTCSVAVMSACGSNGGGGSSPTAPSQSSTPAAPVSATPPSASLQKAINTVLSGVTAAINGTKSGPQKLTLSEGRPTGGVSLAGRRSFTVQCNPSGTSCSVQFNESFSPPATACLNGGSSSQTATLTGVISGNANSVSGTLLMQGRTTFNECSENGWVTNGGPSMNGTIFMSTLHTRINLAMSGGFLITNAPGTPNGRSSCVFNSAILQWDDITGNWANSGSVDCTPGGSFRFN